MMTRRFTSLGRASIFCAATLLLAAAPAAWAQKPLRLIPSPQQVRQMPGTFRFSNDMGVAIGHRADADARFDAKQLIKEAGRDFNIQLMVKRTSAKASVWIGEIGDNTALDGFLSRRHLKLPRAANKQGYILVVEPDRVVVAAASAAGEFYGVQTLKQLLRANATGVSIPCCRIIDWPRMKYRGWQHDISRGPIPTVRFVEREIRTFASYKLNMMTLYTENVFQLKSHPTIAPPDGLTASQVKRIVAYAKPYHVRVVGNFQSFGHFAKILSVPGYGDLGATSWVLNPASPKTYKFLNSVYKEITAAYGKQSPWFDINCDEVSNFGDKPAVRAMVKKMGMAGVYAYHIRRVDELLKRYGKRPMFWANVSLNHPSIISKLPKNLIAMPWAYDPRNSFDNMILPWVKAGISFMVAPGVNNWSEIWPDYHSAIYNCANFTRDGAKHGAMGMLNTDWNDDGETLFNYTWYPFVWSAECSWRPVMSSNPSRVAAVTRRLKTFNAAFDGTFYGLKGNQVAMTLWDLSNLRNNPASGGMGDGSFWLSTDELAQRYKPADIQRLISETTAILNRLKDAKAHARDNAGTLDYAIFATERVRFTGNRAAALQQFEAASTSQARANARAQIMELPNTLASLEKRYATLWNREERAYWLAQNLKKYRTLINQTKRLAFGVYMTPSQSQFSGKVEIHLHSISGGGTIHYTLDGSVPTAQSPVYKKPITLTTLTTIRAKNILPNGNISDTSTRTYRNMHGLRITTQMPTFQDHWPYLALDNLPQTFFWSAGYPSPGSTFTVTMRRPKRLSAIEVKTGMPAHPYDYLHHGELQVSTDGSHFRTISDFKHGVASATIHSNQPIKAIRLLVTAPQQHWLAIPEIKIEAQKVN